MCSPRVEAFLARLYVERPFREGFLRDPHGVARSAGLGPAECEALAAIDREGLALTADALESKRTHSPSRTAGAGEAPHAAALERLERRWEARLAHHQHRQAETGPARGGRIVARGLFVLLPACALVEGLRRWGGWAWLLAAAWVVGAALLLLARSYPAEKARYLRRRARLVASGDKRPA